MQLPMFPSEVSWRPPELSELPSWSGARRVAVDVETRDEHLSELGPGVRRKDSYVVGVSFAIEDGPSYYLPARHQGGDNLPAPQVFAYLRDQAARFGGEVVGSNLSYDLDFLSQEGVEFSAKKKFRDVIVTDPLIYELHKEGYSLEALCRRYGLPGKDEAVLKEAARQHKVHPKSGLWKLPARYVAAYAVADVERPLAVSRRQEKLVDEDDLWEVYDLESDLLPVLVRMRRRGIMVDFDRLDQVEEHSRQKELAALDFVRRETGVKLSPDDVWKADALAPALTQAGLNLGKTSTGKPNIDKSVLSAAANPVAEAVATARKYNKIRTTFAASVRRFSINGRVHCTFNQIFGEGEDGEDRGARYGRLSSEKPNMQQQPGPRSGEELMAFWRSIYIAEEGAEWASADYSQQEPRWTTHFAALTGLPGATEAAQRYRDDPKIDNHTFMAELTGLPRKDAKLVYLGLCYGEGGAKLCDDLGLPTRWAVATKDSGNRREVHYFERQRDAVEFKLERGGFAWRAAGEEGQSVLDKFDERAPFIKLLAKNCERRAKQRGYIRTVGGRRLHFPQRADGTYEWTHKSLNRLIQGSSGDQAKRAMVNIDREMPELFLQLQVHDELNASVTDRGQGERMAELMTSAFEGLVPFRVDLEFGPSWGDIE